MTERREGPTRIIDYREGYEIHLTLAGVRWRKVGGRLTEAKSQSAAMKAIDQDSGPMPKRPMPAAGADQTKYVPRRRWVDWSTESLPHREIERERD